MKPKLNYVGKNDGIKYEICIDPYPNESGVGLLQISINNIYKIVIQRPFFNFDDIYTFKEESKMFMVPYTLPGTIADPLPSNYFDEYIHSSPEYVNAQKIIDYINKFDSLDNLCGKKDYVLVNIINILTGNN